MKKYNLRNEVSDNNENARIEYLATNDTYMHSDNFAWQAGSLLFAGIFVFWGFIISDPPELTVLLVSNLLICLLISVWLFYAEHNRQIYLYKLHRIMQLEKQLGMNQHRRFVNGDYKLDIPLGHHLYRAIYVIISFGGLIPEIIQKNISRVFFGLNLILILGTILIVIIVLLWIHQMNINTDMRIRVLDLKL